MLASPNGPQLKELERNSSNPVPILALLASCNMLQLVLSVQSAHWSLLRVFSTAFLIGSVCSLWQLQILHDNIHGSLFGRSRPSGRYQWLHKCQDAILFWGSMPSVFGYYLYLKFGHLTHHKNVGSSDNTLQQAFASPSTTFEDGDLLFVAHRMKLHGPIGPQMLGKTMSISRSGFSQWKTGNAVWNGIVFALSFLFERIMLVWNDVVVAATGRNFFFPNKPARFHKDCARYARVATLVRAAILWVGSWKSLLYLYLSETLWSIPPHPAAAMFVTNHGSSTPDGIDVDDAGMKATLAVPSVHTDTNDAAGCVPTSSTYAGGWYSILTLNTNFHCEHHDFPRIPLHQLSKLRKLAPDFYRKGANDNVFRIMGKAFSSPDFYACTDVGLLRREGGDMDNEEPNDTEA